MAEKAQHDPHSPWSLTGVTAPLSVQSTDSGRSLIGTWEPVHFVVLLTDWERPVYLAANY